MIWSPSTGVPQKRTSPISRIVGAHLTAGLFLVIPFSMLAKHVDRRLLLVVNTAGMLCSNLFMVIMGKLDH